MNLLGIAEIEMNFNRLSYFWKFGRSWSIKARSLKRNIFSSARIQERVVKDSDEFKSI